MNAVQRPSRTVFFFNSAWESEGKEVKHFARFDETVKFF